MKNIKSFETFNEGIVDKIKTTLSPKKDLLLKDIFLEIKSNFNPKKLEDLDNGKKYSWPPKFNYRYVTSKGDLIKTLDSKSLTINSKKYSNLPIISDIYNFLEKEYKKIDKKVKCDYCGTPSTARAVKYHGKITASIRSKLSTGGKCEHCGAGKTEKGKDDYSWK